jgi:Na+-translocating ferredoxin:NAD+ oxidoreductase RnfG subunit
MKHFTVILLLILLSANAIAGGVYQEPDAFIAEVYADKPPKAGVLWPDSALKAQIKEILGHEYTSLRIRYWEQHERTAWILEEIGKDKPITTGIVINNGRIERVRVLIFRESRGWEVRHAFFTDQFDNASLNNDTQLDHQIDNISGATLSVRAVTKLARVALLLDQAVNAHKESE